ncbi:MAG: PilZ domain-containing protein [Desulfobacterales bacterium]
MVPSEKETPANKRLYKRYKVLDGIFVVLHPSSHSSKLGSMVDISRGGLSFQFIDTKEVGSSYSELDVFVSGHGIKLESLPFEIISDIMMETESPFYPVVTRRVGVKFFPLPEAKKNQVYSFIQKHAIYDTLPDNLA